MRVTAKVPTLLNTLLLKTSANYHMGDLMEFKYERGVALHIPAYHLYIDYTIKQKKIIERELVFFIIDTSQTKVKKDDFNALIEFAHSKINTF